MKISAVMTVKNGQDFVLSAVDSIMKQTVKPIEVVVVDDGSNDHTISILEEIKTKSNIPIVIIRTDGVGRAKALNLAADKASGDWIANLDVDDAWHPLKIEYQVDVISRSPHASIVITDSLRVYERDCIKFSENLGENCFCSLDRNDFLLRNPVNHSSILIKKDVFVLVGRYSEQLDKQIDIDLWLKFLCSGFKFYKVNFPLTVKRIHKDQSFEAGHRLNYSLGALRMGVKQLRSLDAAWYYYPYPFLKFTYNILPGFIRNVRKR